MKPTLAQLIETNPGILSDIQSMMNTPAWNAVMDEARRISRPRPVTVANGMDAITFHALNNAEATAKNVLLDFIESIPAQIAEQMGRSDLEEKGNLFGRDEILDRQDPLRRQASQK